jgi:hypothetical protein
MVEDCMSFFESAVKQKLYKNNQLLKLERILDWTKVADLLKSVHKRDETPQVGGFSYSNLKMFKAILLGQWHSLRWHQTLAKIY